MVNQSPPTSEETQSSKRLNELLIHLKDWVRPLQLALTLEAEKGFKNLFGREEHFNSFISRMLREYKSELLNKSIYDEFSQLSVNFDSYPTSTDSSRKRLVTHTRQYLHNLTKKFESSSSISAPKLKLSPIEKTTIAEIPKSSRSLTLDTPLIELKGIGYKLNEKLLSLGIINIRDLLNYYPRDYIDYSNLKRIVNLQAGETATIVATVRRCNSFISPKNSNLAILEIYLQDITGRIKVTKFFAGRQFASIPYLKKQSSLYPQGSSVAVSGLIKENSYGISFTDPLIETIQSTSTPLKSRNIGRLIPIYNLCEGIKIDRFRNLVDSILPLSSLISDPLEPEQITLLSLIPKKIALSNIHRPTSQRDLSEAKRRLIFDEFLFMQLGLLMSRNTLRSKTAPDLTTTNDTNSLVSKFFNLLPFELTNSQKRVFAEIKGDLVKQEPMARLVQGDVGCGKTVVAVASLLYAIQAGWQGALMAPTEVLAQQHYRNLCQWLPYLNVSVELLTGSTPTTTRRRILDDLSSGNLNILVGTHALIEDPVNFFRLGLVVVDEQHRFGVHQRNTLLNKGLQPHLLTMTATPIPRTLALSIHGDLDISQISELPPGRTPVKTMLMPASKRSSAFSKVKEEILKGQQAYVVLPLVDESDKIELRSAIDVHRELSTQIFSEFNVGLLHGRMKSNEKKSILTHFLNGNIQVLVSTTVIEVGVDVPEASIMVIEHADRFGLAQLHQLRGRVGRGSKASHCILINNSTNPSSKERLEVLVNSNDGFEISEIDLRLRGPGQVLGTKQSGIPDFALASLIDHADVLELARTHADGVLNQDPQLSRNEVLREMMKIYRNRYSANSYLN